MRVAVSRIGECNNVGEAVGTGRDRQEYPCYER
jgi:hypothetical protein